MKRDLFVIFLCFLAGLSGANVQPILTGTGKLLFPENATPANISASSGTLNLNAGGTNQNITLTPSGLGYVQTPGSIISTGMSAAFPSAPFIRLAWSGSGFGDLLSFNGSTSSYQPMQIRASYTDLPQSTSIGGTFTPSYALDVSGDINTSGALRVSGVAGSSTTITVVKTATGSTTCTITFTGGLRTGGTC